MIEAPLAAGLLGGLWGFVHSTLMDYPDLVIIGLFILCGAGLPVPEEPILLMAGWVAHELASGENAGMGLQLTRMTVDCTVGILLGDSLCFYMGRTLGPGILRWRWVGKVLTEKRRQRAEGFFERYGNWSIFIARFFAGVRIVMYFTAGMSRSVTFWRFLLMDFLGVLVSVPISVWAGFTFVKELSDIHAGKSRLGPFQIILVAAIIAGAVVWLLIARKNRAAEKAAAERAAQAPPGDPPQG